MKALAELALPIGFLIGMTTIALLPVPDLVALGLMIALIVLTVWLLPKVPCGGCGCRSKPDV
jgi:hypothetical protein